MNNRAEVEAHSAERIPGDWTTQKDQAWYNEHFESTTADAYGEVIERLWHERTRLEKSLTEWIGIFVAEEEFDPDPVTECLGATAKADLLLRILQAQAPRECDASRFGKDLGRVKSAFAVCDDVVSRYLLQGDKVWLIELGMAAQQLGYSGWQLKDSVRGSHEYKLHSASQMDQVMI
jgi:hypothetical protein